MGAYSTGRLVLRFSSRDFLVLLICEFLPAVYIQCAVSFEVSNFISDWALHLQPAAPSVVKFRVMRSKLFI